VGCGESMPSLWLLVQGPLWERIIAIFGQTSAASGKQINRSVELVSTGRKAKVSCGG
jgi:hypothetical protein